MSVRTFVRSTVYPFKISFPFCHPRFALRSFAFLSSVNKLETMPYRPNQKKGAPKKIRTRRDKGTYDRVGNIPFQYLVDVVYNIRKRSLVIKDKRL